MTIDVYFCVEISSFLHACEGDAVTKLTNEKIPYFNAPIYLQNKTQIGKVDEIFGPINEAVTHFSSEYSTHFQFDRGFIMSFVPSFSISRSRCWKG